MKNSELQLTDVISRPTMNGIAVVKQIANGQITFFRADFSWTGGVLCYVGIEEWSEDVDDDRNDSVLVSRKSLR